MRLPIDISGEKNRIRYLLKSIHLNMYVKLNIPKVETQT